MVFLLLRKGLEIGAIRLHACRTRHRCFQWNGKLPILISSKQIAESLSERSRVLRVLFDARSKRSTRCYKKLNSAVTLIQRTTAEAPQTLCTHRTGRAQARHANRGQKDGGVHAGCRTKATGLGACRKVQPHGGCLKPLPFYGLIRRNPRRNSSRNSAGPGSLRIHESRCFCFFQCGR